MIDEPVLLEVALPAVPEISAEALDHWYETHTTTADRLASLDIQIQSVLNDWRLDRCLEGLAGVTPSISGQTVAPLFPAPRRFLSPSDRARLAGARAGIEHVDVRLALVADGLDPAMLHPETPYVLHALVEGRPTGEDITNPGLARVRDSGWKVRRTVFNPPPADMARPLVSLMIETITSRPSSPPALAAWALFTFLSIHPFVDGNGRTARLLYLLISSMGLRTLDVGALEAIALSRPDYLAALQKGQSTTPMWDPRLLDASPLVEVMYRWSIWGARRHMLQAEAIRSIDERLRAELPGLTTAGTALMIRAWLERGIGLDPGSRWGLYELESMADAELLRRGRLPASAYDSRRPEVVYTPTERVVGLINGVIADHHRD